MRVHGKQVLALVLTLGVLMGLLPAADTASAAGYTDIGGHWALEAVSRWSERGVVAGGGDGTFRPDDPVTRAELAKILATALGYEAVGKNVFLDLNPGDWYYKPVLQCAEAGILDGDGSGHARPLDPVTRQEACKLLAMALGLHKLENGPSYFTDTEDIAPWAAPFVAALRNVGYIQGVGGGAFAPTAPMTRASVVTVLDNAVSGYITAPGVYTQDYGGAVVVLCGGVRFEGAVIRGNLLVAPGVQQDGVILENTLVTGDVKAPDGSVKEPGAKSERKERNSGDDDSGPPSVDPAGTVKIEPISGQTDLTVGESRRITVTSAPADAVLSAVSGNAAVASVTVSGAVITVAAIAPGSTVVTVTAARSGYDSGTVSFAVTVTEQPEPTAVQIEAIDDLTDLIVGEELSAAVDTDPEGAKVEAESADPAVVGVTVQGHSLTVRGMAPGTTAVTITAEAEGYQKGTRSFSVTVTAPPDQPSVGRQVYNFNMDWKFTKAEPEGPSDHTYLLAGQSPEAAAFNDAAWEDVNLPHSFNEDDTFDNYLRGQPNSDPKLKDTDGSDLKQTTHDGERDMYTGKTWYRKHFTLPEDAAGKRVFIEIEGARQAAEVYLNGKKLEGKCENGFIPFGYDLTDSLNPAGEENVIAVMVDNTFPYRTTEFGEIDSGKKNDYILSWHDSHWHPTHGGLYRNVKLYVTDPLHITLPLYSFLKTQGTYVYTFDETDTTSKVSMEAEIHNQYDVPKTFTYEAEVLDMEGESVLRASGEVTLPAGAKTSDPGVSGPMIRDGRAFLEGTIQDAKRWSPDYPYLYTVESRILMDGAVVDQAETPLGIRTWEFTTDTGFYINEHHTKLEGWGQKSTEEWAGLASAYPDWMYGFTMKQMRDCGANYIRWGHVAGSPTQIALADQYGMIITQPGVDGEGHLSTGYGYSDMGYQVRIAAFQDMLIYYRNNPSILLWEYGNQQVKDSTGADGTKHVNIETMSGLIDRWDPKGNRERTARDASSNMLPYMTVVESTDGNQTGRSQGFPILESEYGREEAPRRVWDKYTPGYTDYVGQGTYKDYTAEKFATNQANRWLAMTPVWHSGGGNWIYTDSTSHGRNYSEVTRATGEVDAVRLEKEAYWALQTMWTDEPDAYIIGHWNYPQGTVKPVYVMSDARSVDLFLNGVHVGERNTTPENKYCFKFDNVAWAAGTLLAVGYDKDGREVCRTEKQTHGAPAALRLTPIQGPEGLLAGGDVLLVDVEVVDGEGSRCLTFDGKVAFDTSQLAQAGTGIWRGGYNSGFALEGPDSTYTGKTELYIEAGINRVAVRTTALAGELTLKAQVVGVGTAQPGAELDTEAAKAIAPDTLTVTSRPVEHGDGLGTALPQTYPLDFSGLSYPGIGDGYISPEGDTEMGMTSALIKNLLYSGQYGTVNAKFEASIANPAAMGEPAYNDNPKDSELVFGELPQYLLNGDYVFAPNADADYAADDFIKFVAGRDIDVFVAYDDRIQTKAGFLSRTDLMGEGDPRVFQDTGDDIHIGGQTYSLYHIQMKTGESLTLDTNKPNPTEPGNLYILFAKETRLIDTFLYDDFEMQRVNEAPEGWIVSTPEGTSATVKNVDGIDGEKTNVIHLWDQVTSETGLAIISRKFSPLTQGRYSIKWKVRENGASQQYTRIILHQGPPKANALDYSGFVLETYVHGGEFVYRTVAGDSKSQKPIGKLAPDAWYEIELVVDLDDKTFETYMNGVKQGDARNFTDQSRDKVDHIVIGTRGKGPGDLYFDDVSITPLPDGQEPQIEGELADVVDLVKGETAARTITVTPAEAVVIVASSNESAATAAYQEGTITVTGVGDGEAVITVKAECGGIVRQRSFLVSATSQPKAAVEKIDNITDLRVGTDTAVTVVPTPSDAVITASAEPEGVVKLQTKGAVITLNGLAVGTATVTVRAVKEGYTEASAQFTVRVTDPGVPVDVVLFQEDFSAYTVGEELADGHGAWSVKKSANGDKLSATVERMEVAGDADHHVLHIVDTAAGKDNAQKGMLNISHGFEWQTSGRVAIEWSVRDHIAGNYIRAVVQDGLDADKAQGSEARMAMELYLHQGRFVYRDQTVQDTSKLLEIANTAAEKDTWYQMKAVIDLDAQTYDLYIDGTLKGAGLGFRQRDFSAGSPGAPTHVTAIDHIIFGSANTDQSDFYLADITVTRLGDGG